MPNTDAVARQGATIEDTVVMMQKELKWLLACLDHFNVKQLYTEYCQIRSAAGETQISGPLLLMYDKQNPPVLRRKIGYNPGTSVFVDEWYNPAGVLTAYINTDGKLVVVDGVFTGSITSAAITGGTIAGTTITGGTVKTADSGARIELSNNTLATYNSSGQKVGVSWGNGVGGGFGDLSFYDNGVEVLRFYNALAGGGFDIQPLGSASLGLGATGKITSAKGNWDFSYATVTGLLDNYATQAYATSAASAAAAAAVAAHEAAYHT